MFGSLIISILTIMSVLNCTILTWNVRGIMSTAGSLSKILDDYSIDFAFISEHKLREQQKSFLDSVHLNYTAVCVCDASITPGARCGKGGVAIMYKKTCQFCVSHLNVQLSDRIIGIQINQSCMKPIFAFSVYMPSVNYNSSDYIECFEYLQELYDTFSELGTVIFLGDFNCDLSASDPSDVRLLKFRSFLAHTYTKTVPMEADYTFRPTEKTLDYVIMSEYESDLVIRHTAIDDDTCTVSDHIPLLTTLSCKLCLHSFEPKSFIAWNKCTDEQLNLYRSMLEQELDVLELADSCTPLDIDIYYEKIVNSIHKAAKLSLPISSFNKHAKPYWTSEVKAAHLEQRKRRIDWIVNGRSRNKDDGFYKSYKKAKRKFRKAQTDAIYEIEMKYYSDLESSADCDIRYFWQVVNKRRKTKTSAVSALTANGQTISDPEDISECFADYFSSTFTPSDNSEYDDTFKQSIKQKLSNILKEPDDAADDLTSPVALQSLVDAVNDLKRRKSPGCDNVVNEHIIFGGHALFRALKKLFDKMLAVEYIPETFKTGAVIPVCKPGKRRDAPESYRPITLLCTIYKLFERILLSRLQTWSVSNNKSFPNAQQNAYQKHLGSLTVSFNLQETIAHNLELGSDCYVAFLDASKAFDTVWHDGLFSKLYDFGIRGKALRVIINSYQGMQSYVQVNGVKSRLFQIMQGVRQGGVASTWFYLLYINSLLCMLEESSTGCTIGTLNAGNPTLADDLVLTSPTKQDLETALCIANEYSNLWRFTHNTDKCKLVVFSQTRSPTNVSAKFGNSTLVQTESVSHVGIEIHQTLKSSYAVNARIQKGRGSLFSILSIDKNTSLVNPLQLSSIFIKVCLPTLLYGAELWHCLTINDINKLERFLRLAAKYIQKLPTRTRTDIALGMLGWLPISAKVDLRKLMFLQKLCTMQTETLTRRIFDVRLQLFILRGCTNQLGFIPDILKTVEKYKLTDYLRSYMSFSSFPSKFVWRNIVSRNVRQFHESAWSQRINHNNEFARFVTLHPVLKISVIWEIAADSKTLSAAFLMAKIWAKNQPK